MIRVMAAMLCAAGVWAQQAPVQVLSAGAGEGPAWKPGEGLYFSGGGKITRYGLDGAVSVFRDPSGGSNGLLWDAQGRLVACEARNRRITRTEADGTITVLADNFEGKKFNSPNDLAMDSKGRIYFTDPRYGSRDGMELKEAVYRIDAPGKVFRVLAGEVDRPNGVFVSAKDRYLYVADNNNNNLGAPRKLWRFQLKPDGSAVPGSRKLIFDWKGGRGPDGVKMDEKGRLYVAAGRTKSNQFETDEFKGGVYVLSPAGKLLRFLPVPVDEVTNCAFGGADWKTLYITAGGTLWSIAVDSPGRTPLRGAGR